MHAAEADRNPDSSLGHALALPPHLRAAALGAGLAVCSAEEAHGIASGLIALASERTDRVSWRERVAGWLGTDGHIAARDQALASLVGAWERVPAELRGMAAAAGAGRWERAVQLVVTDASPKRRRGVARVAMDVCDLGIAECAAAMLADPDEESAEVAEAAMVAMAMRAAAASGLVPAAVMNEELGGVGPAWSAGDVDRLAEIMAHAAGAFEQHRKRGAVVAAMTLCGRGAGPGMEALRAWVAGDGDGALQGALRWAKTPVARLRAFEWLIHDGLRGAASERLTRSSGVVEHELVLRAWHLGLRPRRSERLPGVDVPASAGRSAALPGAGAMAMLSARARRGAVGMAGLMRAQIGVRREIVDAALADTSPLVRHAAARSAPWGALADFCFDADACVARSAFLRWSRGRGMGSAQSAKLLTTLRRSADPLVRVWAGEEVGAAEGIDVLEWRRRRRADPVAWESAVGAMLDSTDEDVVLGTLLAVRTLGEAARFGPRVLAFAKDEVRTRTGERIAATAMAMTAEVAGAVSAEAHAVQVRGLVHPNRRVRANAVESLAKSQAGGAGGSGGGVVGAIMELKDDPDHRVRANALRAGLSEPRLAVRAEWGLMKMLEDGRAMHRLAGVWLAGRARVEGEELVGTVREIAAGDPNPHVRARALAVTLRMRTSVTRLRLVGASESESLREVA